MDTETTVKLKELWDFILEMFIMNHLQNKAEVIEAINDISELAPDTLLGCLDIMTDTQGDFIDF